MAVLFLRFKVDLNNTKFPNGKGPIFYKWFPKGEDDSLELQISSEFSLRVWFEAMNLVHPAPSTDPSIQNRTNEPIFGGNLYGKIEFSVVEPEVINALNESISKNVHNYDGFAKKVVKSIVYKNVSKMIRIIKEIYGQFWVRELEPWDSRKRTIYDYCYKLCMQWSFDNEKWYEFKPSTQTATELVIEYNTDSQYNEFLDKDDFEKIGTLVKNDIDSPLSAKLLSEAHMLEDVEDIRYSYITSVSSLESVLFELVNSRMKKFIQHVNQFIELNNKTKLVVISGMLNVPIDDLEKSLEAIDTRNQIIHDGILLEKNHYELLQGLFRVISIINENLIGVKCKFPPLNKKFRTVQRIT